MTDKSKILIIIILIFFINIKNINNFFIIKKSNLKGANLGLFTNINLKKNYLIPNYYLGKKLSKKECDNIEDGDYLWTLEENSSGVACIDGKNYKKNNPLRYVNNASKKKQCKMINLEMIQKEDKIYYKTIKDIKKGEELLVDYGSEYFENDKFKSVFFSCDDE
tara:strand:+ start:806 stop:1297 length:492 start_codon:yes stop_codon:yes gene_type:complete